MDLMAGPVGQIGEFIKEQRENAQLSLRALAKRTGISNPYLSQVERGLRKPSADILAQIATGLSISAEQLLTRAGVLPAGKPGDAPSVVQAITADPMLSSKQRAVLIEIYQSFLVAAQAAEQDLDGPDGSVGINESVAPSTETPEGEES